MARGLDVFELVPGPFLTPNEIEAAKTVRMEYKNVQGQQQMVWPASFALARAYADQLERSGGLSVAQLDEVRDDLGDAEEETGAERAEELNELAASLATDASASSDAAKVRLLADVVRALTNTP